MKSFHFISFLVSLHCHIVTSISIGWPSATQPKNDEKNDVNNIVHLDYGSFRGSITGKIRRHLGIPYAAPPLGRLRFRPPEPPVGDSNNITVHDATEFGKGCMQEKNPPPLLGLGLDRGENCLTVNVWAPEDAIPLSLNSSRRYPVMVWIYGGGYANGYTSMPIYNGEDFVRKSGDRVIVVSFNYRVGIFGFLHSRELMAEGISNVGMLDQVEAFRWVRKYISHFGGDPKQVTAFGESGGAISIGALLISGDGDQKLFDRAIMESGAPTPMFKTLANSQPMFDYLVKKTNCSNGTVPVLECLRKTPADKLVEFTEALQDSNIFYPAIDGKLFKRHPIESYEKKLFSKIPILLGTNTDEGTFFSKPHVKTPVDVEIIIKKNLTFLTQDEYETTQAMYNIFRYKQPFQAAADVIADYIFQCPVLMLAEAYAQDEVPVYKYHFAHRPVLTKLFPGLNELGVFHFAEVPFVFGTKYFLAPLSGEDELSSIMNEAWSDFAMIGDPGFTANLTWPRYTSRKEQIVFETKDIHVEQDFARISRCQFWTQVGLRRYEQVSKLGPEKQLEGVQEDPLPLSLAALTALGRALKSQSSLTFPQLPAPPLNRTT